MVLLIFNVFALSKVAVNRSERLSYEKIVFSCDWSVINTIAVGAYEDCLPNQPMVSYRKDVEDSSSKIMTRKPPKVEITRDAGYFQGPVKSDLNNWYQVNPGALRIDQLDGYQVAWNLSGIPMRTKICTVGRIISSAEGGLMNFRTAQGTTILVDLNGAVVPMGQRVTILGIISSPSVLMIQFVHSIGSE